MILEQEWMTFFFFFPLLVQLAKCSRKCEADHLAIHVFTAILDVSITNSYGPSKRC